MINKQSLSHGFTFIEILIVLLLVGLYYVGTKVLPPWLLETMLAVGWFVLLYFILKWLVRISLLSAAFLAEYKRLILWGFQLTIATTFVLRYFYQVEILISYLVPFLAFYICPFILAALHHHHKNKTANKEGLSARKLKQLALKNERIQTFLQRYPESSMFVIDNMKKHRFCRLICHYRRTRNEREELQEDLNLEVPIDMKKQQIVDEQMRFSHYLSQNEENGSSVLEMAESPNHMIELDDMPLENEIIQKFDELFPRFPLLDFIPLPVALHKGGFQRI